MLSSQTHTSLQALGIEATHATDFNSGLNLLHLISHAFYNGQNPTLTNKMQFASSSHTANNVINLNILLNYIKKDKSIEISDKVRELTPFVLLDEQDGKYEEMVYFVEWLLGKIHENAKTTDRMEENQEMSPPRQHDNQLENLCYVAKLKQPEVGDYEVNEDLVPQNEAERVVRKGSFRTLRPKADSNSKSERSSADKSKEPLRQMIIINSNNKPAVLPHNKDNEQEDDLECRKTVPKMAERPPLHRPRANQQRRQQTTPHNKGSADSTQRNIYIEQGSHSRQDNRRKEIERIDREIMQQEQSLSMIQQSVVQHPKTEQSTRKSSRKIFKIDVPLLPQSRKKNILQWLISSNLLDMSSAGSLDQLPELHRDGVLFMQIADYFKGRGKDLCYFRRPKRSAELHSNYQKLFGMLEEMPQFRCNLLHHYEFFVPQAQQNAFWQLLSSMQKCYQKKVPKESNISRYDSEVSRRVERGSSRRKKSEQTQCEDSSSRFGSAFVQKGRKRQMSEVSTHKKVSFDSNTRSRKESVDMPRKAAPQPNEEYSSSAQRITAYGLIQKEQPSEDSASKQRGYRDLYLCKFKNVETPHKNRSFSNSSMSRSRIRTSLNVSSRKKDHPKSQAPSVTLEMQMKVLSYLKGMGVKEESLELFKDPFRNGLLLCSIVRREWEVDCEAVRRPSNIQDCRKNYLSSIEAIRIKRPHALPQGYEYFVEDLIRGEKNLIYGAIWAVIQPEERTKNYSRNIHHQVSDFQERARSHSNSSQEWMVSWVRHLEKHSSEIATLRIRSEVQLFSAISNSRFLFEFAAVMTGRRAVSPAYSHPINLAQKEANLKKVLGYLVQNNILRSDYLWKTRAIAKQDPGVLGDFLNSLITHYYRLNQKEQAKSVNFVKYLTRQNQNKDRSNVVAEPTQDKLQLNHTHLMDNNLSKHIAPPQQTQKIELPWMRKLGFRGSLNLNNGLIICRLISKLTMKTIEGVNQRPQSKAECLGNIRKAIKQIPKFKWDEFDIEESDYDRTMEVYAFIKEKYKHTYALKGL